VGGDAKIINGYVDEPQVSGEIRVTVIVTGFRRMEPGEEREAGAPTGQQERAASKAPPAQGFGRPVQASGYPETVVEDIRIPAYIRKSRSIKEPFDIGRAEGQATRPLSGSNQPGALDDDNEQIQKGSPDTPAYLRRKNNPPRQ
jgi:cell division protein FtsZ